MAEWLGRRLSTRGSWVRIPAKARLHTRRGICEQDTLKSTARGSHNKQNCLRHLSNLSKKTPKNQRKSDVMTSFGLTPAAPSIITFLIAGSSLETFHPVNRTSVLVAQR
jgi:hypothetical protein